MSRLEIPSREQQQHVPREVGREVQRGGVEARLHRAADLVERVWVDEHARHGAEEQAQREEGGACRGAAEL